MKKEYRAHPVEYKDLTMSKSADNVVSNLDYIKSINWQKTETGKIDNFPWLDSEADYQPVSEFKILYDVDYLYVLLLTQGEDEKNPLAQVEEKQGPVHTDSCLEFFVAPLEDSTLYFNFEANTKGYYKIAAGIARKNRYQLQESDLVDFEIEGFSSESIGELDIEDGYDWGVFLKIPRKLFDDIAEKLLSETRTTSVNETLETSNSKILKTSCHATTATSRNKTLRINAYKCGDETKQPHFACWSNILTENPDFHCPEYFGELIFS